MRPSKCVIGVGSPHGDDRVGWLIADEVQARYGGDDVTVYKVGSPLGILDHIEGIEWLGICDACRGTGGDGEWRCWAWPDERLVQQEFTGTHDFGLTSALNLAQRLGKLPATVKIWGIEIAACQPGSDVSQAVKAAIPVVVEAIAREISH